METSRDLLSAITIGDALDVLIVATLTYLLLSSLGRARARAFLVISAAFALVYGVAVTVGLHLSTTVLSAGLWIVALIAVVAFQDDLRRMVQRITAWRILGGRGTPPPSTSRDCLVKAASRMAERRVGALIVIPGRETVEPHLNGGLHLEGRLSGPLLESIFSPDSPGHDGAVVIERGMVQRFGVHLPLSAQPEEIEDLGTRHTAALGLSERCDALVIVVSEERGEISIAAGGELHRNLTGGDLESWLLRHRTGDDLRISRSARVGWTGARVLMSATVSVALWFALVFESGTVQQTLEVPIEYRNVPKELALLEPTPRTVKVTVGGRRAALADLDRSELKASIDLGGTEPGYHRLAVDQSDVTTPATLDVLEVEPPVVSLRVVATALEERPVRVAMIGRLPPGARLETSPMRVRVRVPAGRMGTAPITTEPVDVRQIEETGSARLILPPGVRLAEGERSSVEVRLVRAS